MKPKKSLGQNFLTNPKVAERIAMEADISKKDTVLEIGPGTGKLTEHLLERARKVIAVEKDNNLLEALQEKFAPQIKSGSLVLVHDDILKFEVTEKILKFFSGPRFSGSLSRPDHSKNLESLQYRVVANIPYNITGAIFKKFLSGKNQPKSMTLMVQREVAERILAREKKESLLSISVKAYGEPKILFRVSRGNFFPAPNVDSAVIAIKNISRKIFEKNKISEDKFWKIVKAGFAHKRKKLSGNLKNVIFSKKPTLQGLGDKRAEDLSLLEWISLAKI